MYMEMEQDIDKVAILLKTRFKDVKLKDNFGWKCPPLDVLDAVLSLNRRYEAFVLPRLYAFKRRNPGVQKLSQLMDLINKYPSPLLFSMQELNYRDESRAKTIIGVVNYCIDVQSSYPGETELERLEVWAKSVKPVDAYAVGVKGFGIAGFQYLRMLLGAQTTKPDVHIIGFINETIGKTVNQETAIEILEKAAEMVNLPVRLVDNAVWQERSQYKSLYD